MKPGLMFLLLFFCVDFYLTAQDKINVGLKAGVSIPNLTAKSNSDPLSGGYSSRLGADAAIHCEFTLTKAVSLQVQLELSQQGGKKNGGQAFVTPEMMKSQFPPESAPEFLYADYKSEAKLNYFMLPVLVKYRNQLGKRFGTYIAAGPFISVLLSAKNVTRGSSLIYFDADLTQPVTNELNSFDEEADIKSDLHSFNAGISGHIGFDYHVSPKGSIILEGGGNYGLIDIQKLPVNGKNKTGAIAVCVGYQLTIL